MTDVGDRKKIDFQLTKDEDDYPPVEWESLWAIPVGAGLWEVDNIPFFVYGVSNRDIVAAVAADGRLRFAQVISKGGHTTLRLIFEDLESVARVRADLRRLGCLTEGSHLKRLVSVDVPPNVEFRRVREYLEKEAKESGLEYEDGCLQHAQ